jgi:hypothetical protein
MTPVERELTVDADAVEFTQIQEICKSQQICKPSTTQKKILQISTDLETVRKSNIRQIIHTQHQLPTSGAKSNTTSSPSQQLQPPCDGKSGF